MMRKTLVLIALATLLVATTALVAEQAVTEDGPHQIKVHKIHVGEDCDQGDCPHMQRRIFISEDGTTTELHGDDLKWVQHPGHGEMHFGEPRGFLGVQFNELTPELREHFGVPSSAGVMISKVVENSPAERAGVRVGDILTRVGDRDISSGRTLMKAIGHAEDGATVNLEVWRSNKVQTLAATLETRETEFGMRKIAVRTGEAMGDELHKVIEVDCDDGNGGDCSAHHVGVMDLDFSEYCGNGEECEVRVNCEEAGCNCTVNEAIVDCPEGIGQ